MAMIRIYIHGGIRMAAQRIEFSELANLKLLNGARKIARRDGHSVEAVVSDALRTYIARNVRRSNVRPEVMAHHRASVEKNWLLYELLADS